MIERLKLPTLLVVSDNTSVFLWMKKNLESRFYLIEAPTEQLALETARSAGLDFIILDSLFEDAAPLELSRKLRQINPTTPIFLITGRLKKSFRTAAIDSGVSDFLNDQLSVEEIEARTIVGQKTATMRKKTSEMSRQINAPKEPPLPDFFKNRLLLNEKALRMLAEMKKKNDSITLLLVRIDHFDKLPEIEEILILLQERLSRDLRPDDLLIPASQGFFIILLPHTSMKDAHDAAEKLRRSVHQKAMDLPGKSLHLTISIVVSPLEASEAEYKKMVILASQILNEEQSMTNLILSLDKKIR